MIEDLKPHKITFFINNSQKKYLDEQDFVIQQLNGKIPCETVNLEKLFSNQDNRSVTPVFSNLRHITLNIVFHSVGYKSAQYLIDMIIQLSPYRPRTQCLIILFNNNYSSETEVESIFRYAWSKKFLNFSILEVNSNGKNSGGSIFYTLNPFVDLITKTLMNSNVTFFPDKLTNVRGYPLKLSFAHYPPKKLQNRTIEVKGYDYPFTTFAIDAMNFTSNFTLEIVDVSSGMKIAAILLRALVNGDINMVTVPLRMITIEQTIMVEFTYRNEKLVAIVPILPITVLRVPICRSYLKRLLSPSLFLV